MINEFCGRPGAGKTYLANKHPNGAISKANTFQKVGSLTKFAIKRPLSSIYILKLCFKHPNKTRMIKQFIFSLAKYDQARKTKKVLGENFIHLGFFLILDNIEKEFTRYLKNIPLPDKVIWVDCPEEQSKQRRDNRGYDKLSEVFGKEVSRKILNNFNNEKVIELIKESVGFERIINYKPN